MSLGEVLFLENDERSIEAEMAVVTRLGLTPRVREKPFMFANYLASEQGEAVVASVLDMHNKDVKDLREIRRPKVQTENGEAVGLAVAESYLREPGGEYERLPLGFLTGYKIQPRVRKRIRALAVNGDDAIILEKGKSEAELERFLRAAVARREREGDDEQAIYQEMVHIARLMIEELFDDPRARLRALGIVPSEGVSLDSVEQSLANLRSIDVRDRAVLLIDMKTQLDAVCGTDIDVQREWLGAAQEHLGGISPAEALKTGHQHGLASVVGILKLITG